MSQKLRKMDYAVRGKVVIAADRINAELETGNHNYPFDRIVYTNIGNPHSVGQKPLTWPRQALALVDLPYDTGCLLYPFDASGVPTRVASGWSRG